MLANETNGLVMQNAFAACKTLWQLQLGMKGSLLERQTRA